MLPDGPLLSRLYSSLYRIRRVEEEVARILRTDKIKCPVHLSTGQEAVSVGVCDTLRADDVVFGSHRNHALYLAKGGNLKAMMAELYGRSGGCAKGRGGSCHLIDLPAGFLGGAAIVAATIPNAVGYAYAQKVNRSGRVVVSVFGDGAVEEGAFHEGMIFAALKQLQIIFICENNLYADQSNLLVRRRFEAFTLARAYGIPSERIGDNDVFAIREAVGAAVEELRRGGEGPRFFECMTYRWKAHAGPDDDWDRGYRLPEEARPWFEDDQVKRVASLVPARSRLEIESTISREIEEAISFAETSPYPDRADLRRHLYDETP